jgi:hypothetical protein
MLSYTCGDNWKLYNNTCYSGYYLGGSAMYAGPSVGVTPRPCNGLNIGTQSKPTLDIRNNILDGGTNDTWGTLDVADNSYNSITEDYNNLGGEQGNTGIYVAGRTTPNTHDQNSVNPLYFDAGHATDGNFHLSANSSEIGAGVAGLTPANPDIGAY